MGVFLVLLHLDCKFATYRVAARVYVNESGDYGNSTSARQGRIRRA